jgi:hypothetical protein
MGAVFASAFLRIESTKLFQFDNVGQLVSGWLTTLDNLTLSGHGDNLIRIWNFN